MSSSMYSDVEGQGRFNGRFAQKMQERIASEIGHRPDMHLGDYRMAGTQAAVLGIGYSGPAPTAEEVETFAIRAFKGRVAPLLASARNHAAQQTVTVRIGFQRPNLRLKEAQDFGHCGGNLYVNASTNETWELQDDSGVPTLYRLASEDELEALLKEASTQRIAATHVRLASCVGGETIATVGCDVGYFTLGGDYKIATVMSLPDSKTGNMVVRNKKGEQSQVHKNMIVDQIRSAELDTGTKAKLRQYFEEMFGDKQYASELVTASADASKVHVANEAGFFEFLTASNMMDGNSADIFVNKLKRAGGRLLTTGPKNIPALVIAKWTGAGFEYQVDVEAAEATLKQQNKKR